LIYPHGHRPVTGVRRHFVEGKKTCGARVDGLEPPTNVEPHGGSGRPSFWERPSRALPDRKGAHCGVSIRLCRLGGCQCNGKGEPQYSHRAPTRSPTLRARDIILLAGRLHFHRFRTRSGPPSWLCVGQRFSRELWSQAKLWISSGHL